MRTMIHTLCRSTGLLLLLALLSGTTVSGQDHNSKLNLSKEFPVTRETTLEIQNKYGKIQVVNWEKDMVQIDVEIRISESSASKLKKLKDDISIDFTGTKSYIVAKSQFKSESKRLASELKSVSTTLSGSNKHVEIDYMVSMPAYMDLELNNKFGDIYMDDHSGDLKISLSNGAIKANRLDGNTSISLKFANGIINTLGSAKLELTYSDLTLGNAGQLDMTSKSSKLNADSVNVLKIDSRRDNLFFQRVEFLYGTSNFSEVWIYDFLRESDLSMKYGKLTVEHVIPSFSKIYVKSEYSDITLLFDEQCIFDVDVLHHEKAVVRLPDHLKKSTEAQQGEDYLRTHGESEDQESTARVSIDALQKCFINLSIK